MSAMESTTAVITQMNAVLDVGRKTNALSVATGSKYTVN